MDSPGRQPDAVERRRHLRDVQYGDDANLSARYQLHRRFSTNRGDFQRWVFDQLDLAPGARVLDVGCGPGYLWAANAARVAPGWTAVLTDFSRGMIATARGRLGERFRYAVSDAEALPHPPGTFDAVLANHMLYHVPDRARAIRELARVLRPDGVLYAVTNGRDHLRELDELQSRWSSLDEAPSDLGDPSAAFGLENGARQLGAAFAEVELRRWEDALEITEVDPVVAYVLSTRQRSRVDLDALRDDVARAIGRDGVLHVSKATGLFVARSPIQSRS
jgi:SAM-dependent methyltransferase